MLRKYGLTALSIIGIIGLALAAGCDDGSPAGAGDGTGDTAGAEGDVNLDLFGPADVGDDADDTTEEDAAVPEEMGEEVGEGLQRYEACGLGGPQCEPPLQCLGTCQLPCTAGCPEGEECVDLSGFGAAGVCGVVGGVGDECDWQRGLFCEEGLFCNAEGQCEGPTIIGEGDECGGLDAQCDEGLTCITTGLGTGRCHRTCEDTGDCGDDSVCISTFAISGACFEDCDPPGDTECSDPAYECRSPIGGDETACLPRFGDPPGERGFGDPCGGEDRCAEGFFCPPIGGGYCTQTCGDSDPCPTEPAGAECLTFGIGTGVCAFTCPGGTAEECPEGMNCVDVFGQSLCAWP